MSPLAGYIAAMRELCASAPDRRTGANARLEMADIGMAAFAVFFLQCPSFLAAQAQLQSRQGRSNARTLFGIERLPTDSHIRSVLDGVPPERFDSIFTRTVDRLDRQGALDRLRRLDGRLLIALDGTECFTSCSIGCRNCSSARRTGLRNRTASAGCGGPDPAWPGSDRFISRRNWLDGRTQNFQRHAALPPCGLPIATPAKSPSHRRPDLPQQLRHRPPAPDSEPRASCRCRRSSCALLTPSRQQLGRVFLRRAGRGFRETGLRDQRRQVQRDYRALCAKRIAGCGGPEPAPEQLPTLPAWPGDEPLAEVAAE